MYRVNSVICFIWGFMYILFFAFFFLTASIVAFEEGFDETVRKKGYPEDFRKSSHWTWSQYMQWVLAWLPYDQLMWLESTVPGLAPEEEEFDSTSSDDDELPEKGAQVEQNDLDNLV